MLLTVFLVMPISVDSEEGKGSEFTVYIPCKLAKEVSDKEETVSKDYDFSGKRVLLVEDNEMNRMIANAILTELGFEVDNAENGHLAKPYDIPQITETLAKLLDC